MAGLSALGLLTVLLVVPLARAENVDPDSDGSQYAYGENVGWLNAEPSGNGGPGLEVGDFEVTGWMWGENIGWVSLSCSNTASCATEPYGVTNDGMGALSGFAWSPAAGWINFDPATSGVTVDPATGLFSGRAWGENIGWLTFSDTTPVAYRVKTSWGCAPPPPVPSASPDLSVDESGMNAQLSWTAVTGATGYDVQRGSLGTLTSSGGDFTTATTECVADNETGTSVSHAGTPASGEGYWYLVRGANCGGGGTQDTGSGSQVEARDAEIAASSNACP